MSILIKDMEIPESCYRCPMANDDFYLCGATEKYLENDSEERRPDWCPLVEIPTPHGRLIAEKTITEIRYHDADGYHIVNGEQLCELEIDAPTVIEAEGSETDA